MCGIAGTVGARCRDVSVRLDRVTRDLRHRGPDDAGFLQWTRGEAEVKGKSPATLSSHVALAHCRLSIIDLGPGGAQPMSSTDGRYHLIYNGEIYNYLELRRT